MTPVKRGEIYYANLCPVVGSEQGGIRTVLIIQNDIGNKFSPTTIIAAITSQVPKHQFPTQVPIKPACLPKASIVKLEQIRTIDKSRLKAYIGALTEQDRQPAGQSRTGTGTKQSDPHSVQPGCECHRPASIP